MYGIRRFGGIVAPVAGGVLLRAGGAAAFYAAVTAAVLVPAFALWIKRRATSRHATVDVVGLPRDA